jgi:hypothetical protein
MSGRHFDDDIALGEWVYGFHDEKNNNWESSFRVASGKILKFHWPVFRALIRQNLFLILQHELRSQSAAGMGCPGVLQL